MRFGDCRTSMRSMIAEGVRVQMCVTSPPYWGLRDYGHPGQLGLEPTPAAYVANMVEVFGLVRELLWEDGTVWLNLGDCVRGGVQQHVPSRVAIALLADGWYGGFDIVWRKTRHVPIGGDRYPERVHEYIYLFGKSPDYYYDGVAIREPLAESSLERMKHDYGSARQESGGALVNRINQKYVNTSRTMKERESVWEVCPASFAGAHFATFPPALIEPCILAGSRPGDTVLDCFMGSGTTAEVAQRLGRKWIGCELNEAYGRMIRQRSAQLGMALV